MDRLPFPGGRAAGSGMGHFRVFGEQGSEPILGVVTLEEFRLAVDPVNHRLIFVPGRLGAATTEAHLVLIP